MCRPGTPTRHAPLQPGTGLESSNSSPSQPLRLETTRHSFAAPDPNRITGARLRPAIVCAAAAREIGKISAFSANGTEFTAEELAKCNEKAR
jgi:hypothetical protein